MLSSPISNTGVIEILYDNEEAIFSTTHNSDLVEKVLGKGSYNLIKMVSPSN